jgi:MEMO1 family protein
MAQSNLRKPVVSGQFYPADEGKLRELIASLADKPAQKSDCLGCILPHAGYIYSGKVAASTVAGIKIRETVVLLGPNHTGHGAAFSIMPKGTWQTPLGNVEINGSLAGLFLDKSPELEADTLAHAQEHSLEVQLPLLQYFKSDFRIIPIAVMTEDLARLEKVAQDLAAVIIDSHLKDAVTFVASSDLTHYEPLASAKTKDALAIEAILDLDGQKLKERVQESGISMCGFAPVAILLKTAKLLGAKKGKLIKYQTSGDASGDNESVVGYAGITIN